MQLRPALFGDYDVAQIDLNKPSEVFSKTVTSAFLPRSTKAKTISNTEGVLVYKPSLSV